MSVRRDSRGRWIYRAVVREITLPDGSHPRLFGTPTRNTKEAAEALEREKIAEAIERYRNAPAVEREEVPTFGKFVEEFTATYVAANNKLSERVTKEVKYRVHLLPAFGSMRLDQIGLREIEAFKANALKKLKAKSVNNVLTVLRKTLRYAVEVGALESAPTIKPLKALPGTFDFLDFEEFERLVAGAEDEELRAMILVAGQAGLRSGELRALQWDDLDLKSGRVTVQRNEYRGHLDSPKGGRSRVVPLTSRVVAALRGIRHLRGAFVFCDLDGKLLHEKVMTRRLWGACRRAGLRRIGWHALRHAFCSHLAMRGAPAKAIQVLAGHSSITTTERYMHLAPSATRSAIDLLEGDPAWQPGGSAENTKT